ncbi:STY4528 family pathogenicity island replication protein [Thiothrix winogradskyi]|uniref:STY4528 family pathogenicity island replication protein n=1 Tax=Thiothrix winogradskyi TaxID=96472 RepID=A0ABY3T569_9GAMM|nr:STY4528 family pathogenicity island replication protein [Thiothrix winogradskyi]UJS26440.1 STY4528 family pathogenicity island replication protein [Thiothrix winogradskyi]
MSSHLQQMIERSATELLQKPGNQRLGTLDGVLFLGNPQLVFPRMLYEDPILEPLERNVWAIIKLHAMDGNSVTAFPTYEELMLRCQVGSKATISRALAILRATRWLTICKSKLRDGKGRVRGNIYALHDEPLQLAETLTLDSDYLEWLENTGLGQNNPHPRVKGLASKLLRDLQNEIKAGVDVSQVEPPLERRSRVLQFLSQQGGNFYGTSLQTVREMQAGHYVGKADNTVATASVQNLYPVHPDHVVSPGTESVPSELKIPRTETVPMDSTVSVLRSSNSSYKETTTTTTSTDFTPLAENAANNSPTLQFPPQLDKSTQVLVRLQVEALPENLRQNVLDVLKAKLEAIAQGISKPLSYGVFPYTRKLCELARTGGLIPVHQPVADTAAPVDTGTELKMLLSEMSVLAGDIRHADTMARSSGYEDPHLASTKQKYFALKKRADELRAGSTKESPEGVSGGNTSGMAPNPTRGVSAGNTSKPAHDSARGVSGGNTCRQTMFNDNPWSNKT